MLTEPPLPWGEYARLQSKLNLLNRVDSYAFGIEAAMAREIEAVQTAQQHSGREVRRAAETAARRERQRAALRTAYRSEIAAAPTSLIRALEARDALREIQSSINKQDWVMLLGVAQGHSADEISRQLKLTPTNVRVRVSRIRNQLLDAHRAA